MNRIFITGASSGIGAALAKAYAARGATLGLVARRQENLALLVRSLPHPERHRIYALDVTEHAALAKAAADFIAYAKGIDVVIANAGISQGTLTEQSEDLAVFERILATNLAATVASFAPFIGQMKTQARSGQRAAYLVGVGSVAGIRGLAGAEAYCASKAAIMSYCESLRVTLRKSGIKVVTIVPGFIDTPMTQANNFPMPFLMPVEKFAAAMVAAIDAGSSYKVIPWQMGIFAKLMRLMPNWFFDWAFSQAPKKARL